MNELQHKFLLERIKATISEYNKDKKKGEKITQELLEKNIGRNQGVISLALNGGDKKGKTLTLIANYLIRRRLGTKKSMFGNIPEFSTSFERMMWERMDTIESKQDEILSHFAQIVVNLERQAVKEMGAKEIK